MERDYTREAQMAAEAYVKAHPYFHGPITSMDDGDADFSLKDAADLIKTATAERQQALRRIEAQRGSQDELAQQRENVSLLPDREAQRIQAEWVEQASAQASRYCQSRNRGATPRATQDVDPDLYRSTLSWVEKQRGRNWWPKKSE
jgi:hypothetical protein